MLRDIGFRSLKELLEEDGEESFMNRIEGQIFGYVDGFIDGLRGEHQFIYDEELVSPEDYQNIHSGIWSSNSVIRRIPDNFTEDFPLDDILNTAREYVDRWFMYKKLFSDKKYAEKVEG